MLKYAVINCHRWDQELQISILADDFKDVKSAEKYRESYLKKSPLANVQNYLVIQYAA